MARLLSDGVDVDDDDAAESCSRSLTAHPPALPHPFPLRDTRRRRLWALFRIRLVPRIVLRLGGLRLGQYAHPASLSCARPTVPRQSRAQLAFQPPQPDVANDVPLRPPALVATGFMNGFRPPARPAQASSHIHETECRRADRPRAYAVDDLFRRAQLGAQRNAIRRLYPSDYRSGHAPNAHIWRSAAKDSRNLRA
uniref:Uncharacterized protein n=1 Tax=Mycena chlorophos TaxID=658473 RepID=A0ABQ0L784_MYCCL|nr:predicted protein [Mycena chlorophos]